MGLTKRKHITRNNRYSKIKGGHSFEDQHFTKKESLEDLKAFAKGKDETSEKAKNLLDGTANFWDDFWEWFKNLFLGSEESKYQVAGSALKKFVRRRNVSYKKR